MHCSIQRIILIGLILTACSTVDEYTYDDVSMTQASVNEDKADELIELARIKRTCLQHAKSLEARLEVWTTQRTTANYKRFRNAFELLQICLDRSSE